MKYTVYGLYRLSDPDKKIVYIGKTKMSLSQRLANHKSEKNSDDLDIFSIQSGLSKQQAKEKELYFQRTLKVYVDGFNFTDEFGGYETGRDPRRLDIQLRDKKRGYHPKKTDYNEVDLIEYYFDPSNEGLNHNQTSKRVNEKFQCQWKNPQDRMKVILRQQNIFSKNVSKSLASFIS